MQHVLAMFVGNLTPILIITSACAAMSDASQFAKIQVSLLQNAMLVAGVVTLVQLFAIDQSVVKFQLLWELAQDLSVFFKVLLM